MLKGDVMPSPADERPVVILRPAPQRAHIIFSPSAMDRLRSAYRVVDLDADPSEEAFEAALPEAFAIIGQPDLPAERLARAPHLRLVLNVEGNFYPNVDYEECFRRGIHVVACGPAYSQAVAEHSVGLAIDLARGISREDRAFREGRERYVSGANDDAILLRGSDMGILGYGNLGRALVPLLAAFRPRVIRAYDPWLPERILRDAGLQPAPLEEVLRESTFLFVLATVTVESTHLLDAARLDLIPPGARLVLASRAAVVDYDALVPRVAEGRFLAAIDVWPEEPMPADHEVRRLEGLVLSAHRAGGIPQAFLEIGEMVLDDLGQVARGLPPARMQPAARELVGRYRNRPVTADTDPARA
jgi:phosphoglycerate dehydrogenase-like enzyme